MAWSCLFVGLGAGSLRAEEPWLLVTPSMHAESYLVGPDGKVTHTWPSKLLPSGPGRMDETGALLRVERDERLPRSFMVPGGTGGRITQIGWDGTQQWSFSIATTKNLVHHDALRLPNGHVLALVWERHEPDEAQSKGRDADKVGKAGLWSECLWELQPQGGKGARIVWEWKAWNHARRFPEAPLPKGLRHFDPGERININGSRTPAPAWAGVTRLEYNQALDQILLVAGGLGGIWILDHSTTTQEASGDEGGKAGKGGRLLYQWNGSTPDLKAKSRKALVVDAEWLPHEEGKGPSVEVLRGVQGEDGRVTYAVERWALPWSPDEAYTMEQTGEYAPPVLKQTSAVASQDNGNLLERPTALARSASGTRALTFGYAGLTRWPVENAATATASKANEHRNESGKTTLRMSAPSPNSLACCAGDSTVKAKSDGKDDTAPLKTLTSAPVLKSRLVAAPAFTAPATLKAADAAPNSPPHSSSPSISVSTR